MNGLTAHPGSDGPEHCTAGNLDIILGVSGAGLVAVDAIVYYIYKQNQS